MNSASVRIESLHVYPVKSCGGIDLPLAALGPRGFAHDRRWMVVDANGRFLTQRTHPALARVRTRLLDAELELGGDGIPPLRLPLQPAAGPAVRSVRIWNDDTQALDAGDEAARWLSAALGSDARLVQAGDVTQRQPSTEFRGEIAAPVNFPDAYPLLVCTRESLDDLRRRMPSDPLLPMDRFRPNIVVSGLSAWDEDRVFELSAGALRLRLVKGCTRCVTTSIDQRTGERSSDPLAVLRPFRYDRRLKGVTFGQNAVIAAGVGAELRVGEALQVTWR